VKANTAPPIPEGTKQGSDEFHDAIGKSVELAWLWFAFYSTHPKEFLKDCIRIVDKEGHQVPLDIDNPKYRKAQHYYFNLFMKQYFSSGRFRAVVLKARQWGCTTVTKGIETWAMVFNPNHRALCIADDVEGVEGILEILRDMVYGLPDWIKPHLGVDRQNRVRFDGWPAASPLHLTPEGIKHKNRSWMRVGTASNEKAGRKWSIRSFSGSEVAFWGKATAKVLGGVSQALAKTEGSIGVLESTGNGWGGNFYERCQKARHGESPWEFVFIPWHWIGEYRLTADSKEELKYLKVNLADFKRLVKEKKYRIAGLSQRERVFAEEHDCDGAQILWWRYTLDDSCNGDELLMAQEYPIVPEDAFIVDGDAVFDSTALMRQMQKALPGDRWDFSHDGDTQREFLHNLDIKAFDVEPQANGRVHVWYEPETGHDYIVSIDPSEGAESYVDQQKEGDNTAITVLDRTAHRVAARVAGRIVPDQTAILGLGLSYWYNGAVLAPENNAGFGTAVIEIAKEWAYPNTYLQRVTDDSRKNYTYKMGWNTGPKSRQEMFSTARAAVRRGEWEILDEMLLRELLSMVFKAKEGGYAKPVAGGGAKDDVCMAFVIGARVDYLMGQIERDEGTDDDRKPLDPTNILYHEWQRMRDEEDGVSAYNPW